MVVVQHYQNEGDSSVVGKVKYRRSVQIISKQSFNQVHIKGPCHRQVHRRISKYLVSRDHLPLFQKKGHEFATYILMHLRSM